MTDEQIEKAAQQYADELRVSHSIPGALVPMLHDIAKSSYISGAQDALSHQWVSVEERLPPSTCLLMCINARKDAELNGVIKAATKEALRELVKEAIDEQMSAVEEEVKQALGYKLDIICDRVSERNIDRLVQNKLRKLIEE